MSARMTPEEMKREQNRLKKQRSRRMQKERGQIVDLLDKRRRVIQNICKGIQVKSNLKELGITIDMIPCDESIIHPVVLEQLKGESLPTTDVVTFRENVKISHSTPDTSHQSTDKCMDSSTQSEEVLSGHDPIKLLVKSVSTFSQLDANHVYEKMLMESKLAKKTVSNYVTSLDKIIKLIGCQSDDIVPCFRSHEHILSSLHEAYPNTASYKSMLSCIISLIKHSSIFKQALGDDVVDVFIKEMVRVRELLTTEQHEKANHGVAKQWTGIIETRKQLSIQKPDSLEYLILSLYTMIPPMRDNFGKVILINDGVEHIPQDESDAYFVNTGRLIIGHYKTHKQYGNIDIILPERLQTIIRRSIDLHPRKYLITQRRSPNLIYNLSKGGKLSAMIEHLLDFGIDDIRHSFATYLDQHRQQYSISERKMIYYIMGHSASMSEFYARQGTKESKAIEVIPIKPNTTEIEVIFHKIGGDI